MDGRAIPSELDGVQRHAWSLLVRAAQEPDSGIGRAVFATRGLDDLPNARTLVLWRADAARRLLWFHSDARSPKTAELARTPWALIVFYAADAGTQLRLHASVHLRRDDALARRAWSELPPETRRVFATAQPPGHDAGAHAPPPVPTSHEAAQAGYGNFVLLEAQVAHLDWLCVGGGEHRRAAFTWDAAGTLHARWLYP